MSESTVHETQPKAGVPAVGEEAPRDEASWGGLLLNGVTTLVIVLAVLLIYHQTVVGPSAQRIAVVDIAEILQLKELEVTASAVGPDVTDEQRREAFDKIGRFAVEMEYAIAELQRDCRCVLLVKPAVVKAAADDLTPALKQRLGIGGLDANALVQRIKASGGQGEAPMPEPGGGQ